MKKKSTYLLLFPAVAIIAFFFLTNYNSNVSENTSNEQTSVEKHATFPSFPIKLVEEKSTLVVKGQPEKVIETFMEGEYNPITIFSFKINEIYKGETQDEYIRVYQTGAYGDEYDEHPLMELNSEYLIYLEEPIDNEYKLVGGPSGLFELVENEKVYKSFVKSSVSEKDLIRLSSEEK